MRAIASMLVLAATTVHAGMLCEKKSGALVMRETCKKHETAMNVGVTAGGDLGLGTDAPTARLDVNGASIFRDTVTFADGQSFPGAATLGDNTFTGDQTIDGGLTVGTRIGIGTLTPSSALSAGGEAPQTFGMERNTTAASPGNALTVQAGGATVGATDQVGGDLALAAGVGTGAGGSGNVRVQAGGAGASGTGDDTLVDRHIVVARAKGLTLAAPGFTSLASFAVPAGGIAGGRIHFTVRATDGGSQIATQTGTISYVATANSITCTLVASDTLHLGTVNAGCTPGFFNPGSQPGVSIFDNVSFSSPAAIVVHDVYFDIDNLSGTPVRLEP